MADDYSSRHIERVLSKHQFWKVGQKGSHAKFRKLDGNNVLTVILPMRKRSIPYGTFRSILRQSGLDIKDFKKK